MKTLGMIGGTSWHSTIEYYRYINEMVGEKTGTPPKNPPLLMYSLNVDLMRRNDWDEINNAYLDIAMTLQNAGAEAIVICANTPHKVYPFVAPKLDIEILHIAEATAIESDRLSLGKLGLLGTKQVMEEGFIKDIIQNQYSTEVITPQQPVREKIHSIITDELTQGKFLPDTKQYLLDEMIRMKSEGAEGIILGCTEIPMIISPDDFDIPLLNTTYLHAKRAVEFILG